MITMTVKKYLETEGLKICNGCEHRLKLFSESPCDACTIQVSEPSNYSSNSSKPTTEVNQP